MDRQRVTTLGALLLAGVLSLGAKDSVDRPPPAQPADAPQEVEVLGVGADPQTRQPLVLLQGRQDRRQLILAIGPFEANGIAVPLQGLTPPRPLTHDLMLTLLGRLEAKVLRIVITDLRDDIYYARVHLDVRGTVIDVDARPSDAIALALRAGVPILVEGRVFTKAERLAPRSAPSRTF